jgi:hypothetical protein
MNRPARKLTHLREKIASKQSRSLKKKPGKRAKRWKKWAATYEPIAQ